MTTTYTITRKNAITSPNGGALIKNTKDSTSKTIDSVTQQRLSSSKSMIIFDDIKIKKDTSLSKVDSVSIRFMKEEKN